MLILESPIAETMEKLFSDHSQNLHRTGQKLGVSHMAYCYRYCGPTSGAKF